MRIERRTSGKITAGVDRLLLGLAAMLLIMMPVDYRGGASLSHAHALFQFWSGSALEASNHHDHPRDHEHAARGPSPGTGELSSERAAAPPPPDVPVLSELTAAAEHGSVLALILVAFLLLMFHRPFRTPAVGWALSAICPRPDPPPPR